MPEEIENLGKGALRDRIDPRDFRAETVFGLPVMDYNRPGDNWKKVKFWRNQRQSQSCVGQGTAYVKDVVDGYPDDAASARSVYGFIFLSGAGGAYIRDGVLRTIKPGIARQSQAPDPTGQNATEARYRVVSDITEAELASGKAKDAFLLPGKDIDWVAWGIENYGAVVFGLEGTPTGWRDRMNPKPPGAEHEIIWGHCLACVDYHFHDGQKCIVCVSSWVEGDMEQYKVHHIKQNYFLSGSTFNPWVIIPKGDFRMLVFFKVKGNATIWSLIDGEWVGFADQAKWISYINGRPHQEIELDQAQFDKLKKNPDVFKA